MRPHLVLAAVPALCAAAASPGTGTFRGVACVTTGAAVGRRVELADWGGEANVVATASSGETFVWAIYVLGNPGDEPRTVVVPPARLRDRRGRVWAEQGHSLDLREAARGVETLSIAASERRAIEVWFELPEAAARERLTLLLADTGGDVAFGLGVPHAAAAEE